MAVETLESNPSADDGQPRFSRRGELVLVGFGVWMIVGLFLDGWAHSEQRPDSFFTPWHAVLYTGFLGAVGSALWQVAAQRRPGTPWHLAVPRGYGATVVGLALFAAGAAGDLLWHQTFGVEANLAALVSPTHLMLMTGALLALTGPFRTAWRAPNDAPSLRSFLPALGSVALATGLALFFTFYLSPFGRTVVARFDPSTTDIHDLSALSTAAFVQVRETWAIAGILFTTVLVLLPVLLLLRRWKVPAGALFIYFAAVALFEGAASEYRRWPLALAVLVAGACAEALARRASIPVVATAIPAALWLSYFGVVAVVYGMGWSAELWTGTVALSALVGLALGLLVALPLPSRPLAAETPRM
jgi:hypothetical protein